ncbi:hypothetical protein PPUJ20005_32430 [Pseudomonas putida]|uniref:Uncharacterized protein n=2 Tax=Bacteria TaxID=2 RepID=A0ABM7ED91_PSEPU|nr:hypothetical protein PP4_19390 [Pseudomonas putida NBRC 14164]GLO09274.1 hypothetical protein PPUJ20005_32430 [Pseudomonas putida]
MALPFALSQRETKDISLANLQKKMEHSLDSPYAGRENRNVNARTYAARLQGYGDAKIITPQVPNAHLIADIPPITRYKLVMGQ